MQRGMVRIDSNDFHTQIFINPFAASVEFSQYKMLQKPEKITKTLAHGYSPESAQREISNMTGFSGLI